MSTLVLIRHGQAAFAQDNYDVLSERGRAQGEALGAHFGGRGVVLDALYAGPRDRHLGTVRAMRDGAQRHGVTLPEAAVLAQLDEYPFQDVLTAALPGLSREHEELRASLHGKDPLRDVRSFDRLFRAAMLRWTRGELALNERYADFRARVVAGLTEIMQREGRKKRVAVVTSAGAIGAVLGHALELSDEHALRLSWVMANTALAELFYNDTELTVSSFNATPHLTESLVTYR